MNHQTNRKNTQFTMETRLQSNEIRIPKPEFDLKSSYLNTSTGSTGSQNSSTNSNGTSGNNCQQHYFKSSFARSLTNFGSSSTPQSKSLDFAINYGFNSIAEGDDELNLLDKHHHHLNHHQQQHFLHLQNGGSNSPLSMPPMYSTRYDQEDEEEEEVTGNERDETEKREQSSESLVSSSSMATVKNVWTGGNAQVCRRYLTSITMNIGSWLGEQEEDSIEMRILDK